MRCDETECGNGSIQSSARASHNIRTYLHVRTVRTKPRSFLRPMQIASSVAKALLLPSKKKWPFVIRWIKGAARKEGEGEGPIHSSRSPLGIDGRVTEGFPESNSVQYLPRSVRFFSILDMPFDKLHEMNRPRPWKPVSSGSVARFWLYLAALEIQSLLFRPHSTVCAPTSPSSRPCSCRHHRSFFRQGRRRKGEKGRVTYGSLEAGESSIALSLR